MADTDVKECTIRIHGDGEVVEKTAAAGSNLYSRLTALGFYINAPCGGNGTCGKCLVRVSGASGDPSAAVSDSERSLLGKRMEEGYRLACRTEVFDGMDVWLPEPEAEMKILSRGGHRRTRRLHPLVRKTVLTLGTPDPDDQTPHWERLRDAWKEFRGKKTEKSLREMPPELSLNELRRLHGTVRAGDPHITIVDIGDRLAAVEPGDTSGTNYCAAFDIGTTTIAGYLVDLESGQELTSSVSANPQRTFGADVISRIGYTMNNAEKLEEMHRVIVDQLNAMIAGFEKKANISSRDIYAVTVAGNTTMMHFLMGLPADGIAMAPFVPVTTEMTFLDAHELGLHINENGSVVVLPCVSAYVGADTVAAVLSTGMHKKEEISLLVDIGTNGEIVLGNRERMVACSAAAGPAFEGAGIRNGVSSVAGAIDKVNLHPRFEISTIGNAAAVGICGSGIVDAVAELRSANILDGKGKFVSDPSVVPSSLRNRLTEISGQRAFLLAGRDEYSTGIDIAVTQKDVRELQNAKAAIAAGIRILSETSGIPLDKVDKVYLAGGFGSYINIDNAMTIGLLPRELAGKIVSVGNAAGAGAVDGLLSRDALHEKNEIKQLIEYIELSYSKEFLRAYMDSMKL